MNFTWTSFCPYLSFIDFEKVLKWIIEQDSSVNFYMFHGGTNFGFMNGANEGLGATNQGGKEPYQADVTSYGQYNQMVAVFIFYLFFLHFLLCYFYHVLHLQRFVIVKS